MIEDVVISLTSWMSSLKLSFQSLIFLPPKKKQPVQEVGPVTAGRRETCFLHGKCLERCYGGRTLFYLFIFI